MHFYEFLLPLLSFLVYVKMFFILMKFIHDFSFCVSDISSFLLFWLKRLASTTGSVRGSHLVSPVFESPSGLVSEVVYQTLPPWVTP